MLREVFEDALQRGERLKEDIIGQILKSATLRDLLSNKRFLETAIHAIQKQREFTASLRRNIQEILKLMSIPNRGQIDSYQKRIEKLEGQIDHLGRQMMKKGLKKRSRKRRR